jgi:alanyl-tRNA synthetase
MGKKYDPLMHTAEHILNQAMIRLFDCGRSINAHIEKKKSKCDYRFQRPLTAAETDRIQAAVNRVIRADLPVTANEVAFAEAEAKYFTGKLPEGAGERIRIVCIGDYDACPCIGRHARSTGELGEFRIASTQFENGILRIRYKLAPPHDRVS